jgi:hypothetical protein
MTFDHAASRRIDRATKSNSDSLHVVAPEESLGRALELLEYPFGSPLGLDSNSLLREEGRSIAGTNSQLQLGATDFNTEEHMARPNKSATYSASHTNPKRKF